MRADPEAGAPHASVGPDDTLTYPGALSYSRGPSPPRKRSPPPLLPSLQDFFPTSCVSSKCIQETRRPFVSDLSAPVRGPSLP